jgi:hypothetical protein
MGDLEEVLVWTSSEGYWAEHATFLLRGRDGRWHAIGFGDPAANQVVDELRKLPGFDEGLLLTLIGQRARKITMLWRRPPCNPSPSG